MIEQKILLNKPMRFDVGDHTVRVSVFSVNKQRKFAAVIDRPGDNPIMVSGLPSYETVAAVCTQLCDSLR